MKLCLSSPKVIDTRRTFSLHRHSLDSSLQTKFLKQEVIQRIPELVDNTDWVGACMALVNDLSAAVKGRSLLVGAQFGGAHEEMDMIPSPLVLDDGLASLVVGACAVLRLPVKRILSLEVIKVTVLLLLAFLVEGVQEDLLFALV